MPFTVESYYRIKEKEERLSKLYADFGRDVLFLVPSSMDKEPMYKLISKNGSFFGARPSVMTVGELYRETSKLCGTERPVIDPPDHNLIIKYILDLFLKECSENGRDLPPGMKHKGFVSVVGDSIKELIIEDVSPEHLQKTLFNGESPDVSVPEAVLLRLYGDYLLYLEENDIADAAQVASLLCSLLAHVEAEGFLGTKKIIVIGFLSFTGSQLKLMKALSNVSDMTFILPESGIDDFHDAITQLGAEYTERPKWSVKTALIEANNKELELAALAREIALWTHGRSTLSSLGEMDNYGDIGVLLRPDALDSLANSLERYKIPYNVQVRQTVGEGIAGELPRMIWNSFTSGWDTKSTAFLMTNPLFGGNGFRVSDALGVSPEGAESWLAYLKGREKSVFKEVLTLCSSLTKGGTPSEILTIWHDFLLKLNIASVIADRIEDRISLDGVIKDLSSVMSELKKKIESLDDIRKDIGEAASQSFAGSDAVSYISDWGRTATLPIPLPQSKSLTLYCSIPPILTSHKYWVMTDIDYNTWPGKLRESPLFRNESKKQINSFESEDKEPLPHVPDIHEEREQKEAIFRRIIATGEEGVIITRSLTDMSGRPVGASQFTESLFESKSPREYKSLCVIEYPLSKVLPAREDDIFPEAEVSLCAEMEERGPVPRFGTMAHSEEIPVINLSDLDTWIECPYLYWARNKLKLDYSVPSLYDARLAGTFLHKLWEVSLNARIENGKSIYANALSSFEDIMKNCYPALFSDARLERYKTLLMRRASDLAEHQDLIEERAKGRTGLKTEYKIKDFEFNGAIFRGRCDRIDYYGSGAVVLDYKLGKSVNHKEELQLAAYAYVLRETEGIEPLGFGWFGHSDNKLCGFFDDSMVPIYFVRTKTKQRPLDEIIDKARDAMADMALSVKQGIFKAKYTSGAKSRCALCSHYTLCRRREVRFSDIENEEYADGGNDNE